MPRAGGVYTLPAGNPVVTLTVISSSWANTTLSDIATALTGSVPTDGSAPLTGQLRLTDGIISAPGRRRRCTRRAGTASARATCICCTCTMRMQLTQTGTDLNITGGGGNYSGGANLTITNASTADGCVVEG